MMRKINLAIEGNYDAKVYYRDRISVKQILRITVNDCLVPNC